MDDVTPPRRRRVIRWVLAGSLGLNLLFVGAFAGAAYRGMGTRGGDGASARGHATPYVQALPRDTRRAMFQALRSDDKTGPAMSRKARRGLHRDMVAVLRATPFDPAAAKRVLNAQRDAVLNVQTAAQDLWLQHVTEMDAPTRAAYADTLETVLQRRSGRRAGDKNR